jgi:hypothetical protein
MSTTTSKCIIVKCKAIRTRADEVLKQKIGDEVTLYAGEWHGMGGWKQPAWTEYGPMTFRTIEAASQYICAMGGEYGYKIIEGTMKYCERTTVTTITEVELEDA